MMHRTVHLLTLTLALTLVSTQSRHLDAQEAGISIGTMAPAAMVETLDGRPMDLATYIGKGKPVVLEFWATWCPLCRKLEPAMQAARTRHAGQVTFVSVGVSSNQSPERQRAHVAANGMGGEFVFDRHDAATKAFAVPHTSYVVVLDGRGKVVYTGVGAEQDIEAAVQKGLSVR
jgi:thiol-disulfide isomerase/thioredoxin